MTIIERLELKIAAAKKAQRSAEDRLAEMQNRRRAGRGTRGVTLIALAESVFSHEKRIDIAAAKVEALADALAIVKEVEQPEPSTDGVRWLLFDGNEPVDPDTLPTAKRDEALADLKALLEVFTEEATA